MINITKTGTIVGVLIVFLLNFTHYAGCSERNIKIAILPCKDIVMTFKRFNPLITYLKKETGFDIKLLIPRDSVELERDLRNGDIDFVLQDPYTYVRLGEFYNKANLLKAITREGTGVQSGLVIVRKDSGIKTLEDLKGKTVMFGPKLSATTWVAAKLLFEQKGIAIDKALKGYSNGMCCEDIAFNVYIRKVDAGVVCDHFLEAHSENQKELGIDPKEISVIDRTRFIPTNVFAASRVLREDVIIKINQTLLRLDKENSEHAKLLYPAELGGFEESRDAVYGDMRMFTDK